jgi:transcriptional regulator with XRE-family HTH domain
LLPRGPTGESAGPRFDQDGAPTPTLARVLTMLNPHPIDVHVGMRIRQRRILLGMTQETLGAAVGLSFQMIQKYEVGINCIFASRLVEVAKALDVPPSFFFEGPRSTAKVPLHKRETLELVHAYTTISNSSVRHSIAETIQAIAATAPSDRRRS